MVRYTGARRTGLSERAMQAVYSHIRGLSTVVASQGAEEPTAMRAVGSLLASRSIPVVDSYGLVQWTTPSAFLTIL